VNDVNDKRPKNIDFSTLKLPLPAITSITHRVSGGILFFAIAILLFLLSLSLESEQGFSQVTDWLDMPMVKLIIWGIVAALLYHLIAGIKHLLMDIGIGETLAGGVIGAKLVIGLSVLAIIGAGIWLW